MAVTTTVVTFPNASVAIAGILWHPDSFDVARPHPALVLVTPGSSVKEQIGSLYGRKMAERGYVCLVFDPAHQGESGGEPRNLENPATRVEDVRCAIDFLAAQTFVDDRRIGVLGICAGGGYAVNAASTDRRIKAVGTVVPVNIGPALRQAVAENGGVEATLTAVGAQRTAEARGGDPRHDPWIPDSPAEAKAAGIVDPDLLDAVNYYRMPRGQSANSTNRLYFASMGMLLGYDGFNLIEELLVQPVQVVVGGRRGSVPSFTHGRALFDRAQNAKGFFVVEGAGHYELYDVEAYVDQAVAQLTRFYGEALGTGHLDDRRETDGSSSVR